MTSQILISDDEIKILNAARTVLIDIDVRAGQMRPEAGDESYGLGRLAATSFAAHGLMFSVLNIAKVYCGVDLTNEQVHNNPPEILTLAKPKPRSVVMNDEKEAHAEP